MVCFKLVRQFYLVAQFCACTIAVIRYLNYVDINYNILVNCNMIQYNYMINIILCMIVNAITIQIATETNKKIQHLRRNFSPDHTAETKFGKSGEPANSRHFDFCQLGRCSVAAKSRLENSIPRESSSRGHGRDLDYLSRHTFLIPPPQSNHRSLRSFRSNTPELSVRGMIFQPR